MIKNDKQYQVTKSRLKDFEEELAAIDQQQLDKYVKELKYNTLLGQMEDFQKEIKEYESLKDGSTTYIYIDSLSSIHEALIKGRIAKKWTQAELAGTLAVAEQQIQRYEMNNYSTASIDRVAQVANALNIEFEKIKVRVNEPTFTTPGGIDENTLSRFRTEKSLFQLAQ